MRKHRAVTTIDGTSGADSLHYQDVTTHDTIVMNGYNGDDFIFLRCMNAEVYGGAGDDTISFVQTNNTSTPGGNIFISGGMGDDTVIIAASESDVMNFIQTSADTSFDLNGQHFDLHRVEHLEFSPISPF